MSQRLVLLVEGHTEHQAVASFLKRWLDARLEAPVGISTVRFDGWSDLVSNAAKKTELYLEKVPNRADNIAVIGLIDLYGPTFYPEDKTTVSERYAYGKGHVEALVGHARYRQHFAVHETEAWLLSDLTRFQPEIRKALEGRVKTPETVNFKTPPSKLLDEVYMRITKRHYSKVTEARNHFPHLDPELAAGKCPYLQQMLTDLLAIVQQARV